MREKSGEREKSAAHAEPTEPTGHEKPAEPAEPAGHEKPAAHEKSRPAGHGEPGKSVDPEKEEPTVRDPIAVGGRFERARRGVRRFPLFTRDTARPEGGGRAAPGDAPAPARQWPILVVLLTVGLGLLLTAFDAFRVGTILVGVALLGGAALRWALPDVGMLAVRSRFTDLLTYGTLGVVIVLLALMAQPSPWLVIPFLDDTLHFTIST
ncbi:membrane protein [Streptomyces griseoaurantiacus]|nr:membrane protein [Streptomyces griseoaurantiacus]